MDSHHTPWHIYPRRILSSSNICTPSCTHGKSERLEQPHVHYLTMFFTISVSHNSQVWSRTTQISIYSHSFPTNPFSDSPNHFYLKLSSRVLKLPSRTLQTPQTLLSCSIDWLLFMQCVSLTIKYWLFCRHTIPLPSNVE